VRGERGKGKKRKRKTEQCIVFLLRAAPSSLFNVASPAIRRSLPRQTPRSTAARPSRLKKFMCKEEIGNLGMKEQ